MDERAIMLNELAQDLRPLPEGVAWFEALSPEAQGDVLVLLCQYCLQADASTEDGPEAVLRSGLRPTHTPAVLITRGRINEQLGKIARLAPPDERRKAFRLLVSVFAVADDRRRALLCAGGCNHEWHWLSPSSPGPWGHGVGR
ncbi:MULTISPECIES: DUF5958 family protein [unclassified Streptomyces]|uniref:DUF5958 family protein n=1 Tax=unclassified Streptomyces TaxID=2593676 RepID=UPI0037F37A75